VISTEDPWEGDPVGNESAILLGSAISAVVAWLLWDFNRFSTSEDDRERNGLSDLGHS
jgi:hypothetical protein